MDISPLAIPMIERGDVVSCHYWEKDGRPAVVLRVCADGRLFLVAGTKLAPSIAMPDAVQVLVGSRYGRLLGLTFDTWFKKQGVAFMLPNKVSLRSAQKCPPELLLRLDKLVGM
jgi:hypothetical protein